MKRCLYHSLFIKRSTIGLRKLQSNDILIQDSWFCKQYFESTNIIFSDWWNLIYDVKSAHAYVSILRPYWCVVFVRQVIRRKKGIFNYNIYSPNICFVPSKYIRITRYIYVNIMSLLVTTRQGSSLKYCGIATSASFTMWPRPNDKLSCIWLVFDVYKIFSFQRQWMHAIAFAFFMICFQLLPQLYVWYIWNLPYRYLYYIF